MWANKISQVLIAVLFIFSIMMFGFPGQSPAVARFDVKKESNHYSVNRKDDISKILSVLEKKTGDQKLVEKAKDKLFTLSRREIQLITSLCERISHDSYSAGADIAFLLIITLIIFS